MVRVVSTSGRVNLGSAEAFGAYSDGVRASTTSVSSDFCRSYRPAAGEIPIQSPVNRVRIEATKRQLAILSMLKGEFLIVINALIVLTAPAIQA